MSVLKNLSVIFHKVFDVSVKVVRLYRDKKLSLNTQVCAFSFLFSLYPIVMLLVMVCFFILKAHPVAFAAFCNSLVTILKAHNFAVDPYSIIAVATTKMSLTFTNVILIATIVWLSRRLFLAIFSAMTAIFGEKKRRSPVIEQLLTMGCAVLFVIGLTAIFTLSYLTRQILHYPIFNSARELYPWIYRKLTNALTNGIMHFVLLSFTFFIYKAFAYKARLLTCLEVAATCTFINFLCITILSTLVNRTAYIAIYGVIASLIIMLIEVMAFFGFFMLGACFIAVIGEAPAANC